MFYENSCWKCILNYAGGIFQAEKSLVEYRSGADHYLLNTLVPDSVFALSQILLTMPISHGLCPPSSITTAITQFPMVTGQRLSPTTHTDQPDPDIGLTEKIAAHALSGKVKQQDPEVQEK